MIQSRKNSQRCLYPSPHCLSKCTISQWYFRISTKVSHVHVKREMIIFATCRITVKMWNVCCLHVMLWVWTSSVRRSNGSSARYCVSFPNRIWVCSHTAMYQSSKCIKFFMFREKKKVKFEDYLTPKAKADTFENEYDNVSWFKYHFIVLFL